MRQFLMVAVTVAMVMVMPATASAAAGEFAFVVGQVSLAKANGQRSTPAKGTAVDPGDTIATGADGMVQLTMVDQARFSLRPNTQFVVERYPDRRDAPGGAVLNLVKGTLRTFTGLLSNARRERFVMKTTVATVGIRGSGNILYACEGSGCDPSVTGGARSGDPITISHTILGSHSVTNEPGPGGSPETLVTGPGQTVQVQGNQPPRRIPTPRFISNAAITMAGDSRPAQGEAGLAAPPRVFAPSDVAALPPEVRAKSLYLGGNGLGFSIEDATGNPGVDLLGLRDVVVVSAGAAYLSQATPAGLALQGGQLRGFDAYEGLQSGVRAVIGGGTLRDAATVALPGGESLAIGRTEDASFALSGSGVAIPGSVHWAYAPSGFPPYLSDVLTGSATYTLAAATAPTNQNNTAGSLGSASLEVNFTNRTLNLGLSVTIPAASGNAGGLWTLSAIGVPFAANTFYASTVDRLVITRGTVSSRSSPLLAGNVEGSFVGRSLAGAILGYGFADQAQTPANWNFVSGVAAFSGPAQSASAPYREGRISDPLGTLSGLVLSHATTNRPDEVVSDGTGRVTAFTGPFGSIGSHATYAIGSAQVVQSGLDPETGLIWGRWSGGTAQVSGAGQSQPINLASASLHYIFAGAQAGPVNLPLTGTGLYDVIGSTSPTDASGHVGTLNSAALNVNFTQRRLDANVSFGINGQAWTGSASNVPIYRDQYFSAFAGMPTPGLPTPSALIVTCTPGCGANATGSFDGFFSGRGGQRAGLLYNLGGNHGTVAFGRRGG